MSSRSPSLYSRLGVTPDFDSNHNLVTSPFFSTTILAILRIILAFYSVFSLLFSLLWISIKEGTGSQFFVFFTNLSYTGIAAYFCFAAYHTSIYAFARNQKSYPLQSWPKLLQFLHLALLATVTTFPIVVTLVFWGLLASTQSFDQPFDLWGDVSFHTLNAVFALFEIILTNIPALPWLLVLPTEAVLAAYLGIAYITRQTQGFYPYPFLDPSEQGPFLAVYIVGMGVIQFIFFTIVRFTAVLRSKLRRQPRSSQPPPQDVESLEKGQDVESTKVPVAI